MGIMQLAPLVVLVVLMAIIGTLGVRRSYYGEPCSPTVRCDSRGSLACQKGLCGCTMPDTMVYDKAFRRCGVLSGEKCVFTAVQLENVAEERSWREEMPCLPNASCENGFCTCYRGFYETSNGTCAGKKGHREDCESSSACRDDQYLDCTMEGRCDCNGTLSTFDFSRQMCVRRANAPCDDFPHCVEHAYCDQRFQGSGSPVCVCDGERYFANTDGICERKRGFGEKCESNDFCIRDNSIQLVCNADGQCGCNVTTSMYERNSKRCVLRAGAQCVYFGYGRVEEDCIENSQCGMVPHMSTNGEPEPRCDCMINFFESSNGTCELKREFGEPCESHESCKELLKCNEEKICKCDPARHVYDEAKGKCIGLVGAECEDEDDCITNAYCSQGVCRCRSEYSNTSSGNCLATYRSECSKHWTSLCNDQQGLTCKEGRCVCKYEELQVFDTDLKTCTSLVNAPCNITVPCVTNSHCSEGDGGTLNCQCNKDLVTVDGQCQLSIGQSCNYSSISVQCDQLAPLHCIDGICQCAALQVYDNELLKCRGLVGSPCWLDAATNSNPDNNICIRGAKCIKRRFMSPSKGVCKCQSGWVPTTKRRCLAVNSGQEKELTGTNIREAEV